LGEFTAQNLTTRPTFFGCSNTSTPLLIYLANGGPPHDGEAPITNTPTTQLNYELSTVQAMLSQTFVIATQGYPADGATKDPDWPSCLACAIVDRARERAGEVRSGICSTCLDRYCWNGSTLTTTTSDSPRRISINHSFGFAVASAIVTMMVL